MKHANSKSQPSQSQEPLCVSLIRVLDHKLPQKLKTDFVNIHDANLERLTDYLKLKIDFDFQSIEPNHVVLVKEEYYFRNTGYQCNTLILKRHADKILIDLIATGGEITNFLWGSSEVDFIERTYDLIYEYAKENNITFEDVEI